MVDVSLLLSLVDEFGILGVFIGSLIGSATIFLPLPSFLFVFTAGAVLNPLLVGAAAGLGSAVGELVGYAVGLGIHHGHKKLRKVKTKKEHDLFRVVRKWFSRKMGFLIIIFFALSPLPDDVIGIFCGIIKYDLKKFFLAMLIGKIILGLGLAYAGFYGLKIAEGFL